MQVKIFKALAHPVRLKIVKALAKQSLCVCELNADVEFSQSNLSQHLKILREAGVVYSKKEGLRINYYIRNQDVRKLLDVVDQMIIRQIEEVNQKIMV